MSTSTAAAPDQLITLAEAAQRLAISKRTLERLIASRQFPAPLKIGRSSRISTEDVATYLAKLRQRRAMVGGLS